MSCCHPVGPAVGQHELQPGEKVPATSGAVVIRRHPARARAVLYGKDISHWLSNDKLEGGFTYHLVWFHIPPYVVRVFNFGASPMLRFIGLLQIVIALPSLRAAKGVFFWFCFVFAFFFL